MGTGSRLNEVASSLHLKIAPSFEEFFTPKYAENAGVGTKVKYSDKSE